MSSDFVTRLGFEKNRPNKPIDLRFGQKYPSAPPKVRAMSAVIGIACTDGIILAADQQISLPDYCKRHESKITGPQGQDWTVLFAYSGSPSLMKEVSGRIQDRINSTTPDVEIHAVHAVAESVLDAMNYRFAELDLDLLIAVTSPSGIGLLRFDGKGKALYVATGIEILGVGDSSLLRYFSDRLYEEGKTDLSLGAPLALYMVEKAKAYVNHCGGPTDLLIIRQGNSLKVWTFLDQLKILNGSREREKEFLKMIILPPGIQPSAV